MGAELLGIASRMGLWLECPTIEIAESRLYGLHAEVGPGCGDRAHLIYNNGNVIGIVLRRREKTKPLFVSPGNLIELQYSLEFVMACATPYRPPEPPAGHTKSRAAKNCRERALINLRCSKYIQDLRSMPEGTENKGGVLRRPLLFSGFSHSSA